MTHDELRALASAATPGEWTVARGWTPDEVYSIESDRDVCVAVTRTWNNGNTEADANYIAAANPATVISLLDEVTRLRAAATSSADALYRYHLIGMINGHDYGLCVEEDECRICTTIRTLRAAIEEAPQ